MPGAINLPLFLYVALASHPCLSNSSGLTWGDILFPNQAVRDKNREAASAKQRHKDPLQDALLRTQEEIQQAQAHQMQLAEDIRLARVQPPPPPVSGTVLPCEKPLLHLVRLCWS